MSRMQVTELAGVGVMRTFRTEAGDWIGVLELHSGHRQLFVDDPADPDNRRLAAVLQPAECNLLAEMLGVEATTAPAEESPNLVDWVLVHPRSAAAGNTVGDLQLRSRTGASIAAILRDETYTDIEPTFRLHGTDIVLITGGKTALAAATALLRHPVETS
jgi:TrkA domain protein